MLELLTKDGIKTLNDFATCADWEIAGGYTTVDGKRVKDDGLLEPLGVTIVEARNLIMKARLDSGLISQDEFEKEINGNESEIKSEE